MAVVVDLQRKRRARHRRVGVVDIADRGGLSSVLISATVPVIWTADVPLPSTVARLPPAVTVRTPSPAVDLGAHGRRVRIADRDRTVDRVRGWRSLPLEMANCNGARDRRRVVDGLRDYRRRCIRY